MATRIRVLLVTAVALVVMIGGAWAAQAWASRNPAKVYAVAVERDGKELRRFTFAELEAMKRRRVRMQGQYEEGPTLLSVLDAAGARSFSRLTVTGTAARDDGRLSLTRDEVDNRVLLDLAIRGTAKLCGPNIPMGRRVRDVVRLAVD